MRYLFSFVLGLALLGVGTPAPTAPIDLSTIVAAAKPAVVFILAKEPAGTLSGSGFVIASTATESTIVTANHVVEGASQVDVIFDNNQHERYTARVIRHDHVRDVAVLSVGVGNRPTLKLALPESIREGMSIALIGYPMTTFVFEKFAGDTLRPSVHAGIVSAIRLKGELIQFDAATFHGDSGGPILDAHTGDVIAIVHGEALDPSYYARGLEKALPGTAFGPSAATIALVLNGAASGAATTASGVSGKNSNAYHMGYFLPTMSNNNPSKPFFDTFTKKVLERVPAFFTKHNQLYLVTVHYQKQDFDTLSMLSAKCEDNNIIGVIIPVATWSFTPQLASVKIEMLVADCHGIPYFRSAKEKSESPVFAHRTPADEIVDMGNDLLDQLLTEFSTFRAQHLGAWKSLTSVGLAFDPAAKGRNPLMFLDKVPDGYRITNIIQNGPADLAGLRTDDIIASIDGKPTTSMPFDELSKYLDNPTASLTILRPGGPVTIVVHPMNYNEVLQALSHE